MDLFGRIVTVQVDTLLVSDLRIAFKIEKSLTKNPNTLDVAIYNLSEESRKRVQRKGANVRINAGYAGNIETLFTGTATIINSARQGPDWLTRLQSADGIAARSATVSESFAKGTPIATAMQKIAGKTGLGVGNLLDAISSGNVRNTLTQYTKGFAASGLAVDELSKMARTMGYEFSVQDNAIQLSQPGKTVGNDVVELRAETGLIGSPELSEVSADATSGLPSGAKKTVLKVRSLIQQKLTPGRAVHLKSQSFDGFYRIEKTTFSGDTHAEPWFADCELSAKAL